MKYHHYVVGIIHGKSRPQTYRVHGRTTHKRIYITSRAAQKAADRRNKRKVATLQP